MPQEPAHASKSSWLNEMAAALDLAEQLLSSSLMLMGKGSLPQWLGDSRLPALNRAGTGPARDVCSGVPALQYPVFRSSAPCQ